MESELVFLKTFVNNVGAEISRMNTIAADRSKSDFIGSVCLTPNVLLGSSYTSLEFRSAVLTLSDFA
jgi:hypothetical protein